jgi:hypothetical protein
VTSIPGLVLPLSQFIQSICTDPQGNIYVLSNDITTQATIRKLDGATGTFSIVAHIT